MPIVSVIIPAYNHGKFIRECIQSVLDQTFQDFEVIITDDFSTDNTVGVIESFNDPRIKLFKHAKNLGVSITANECIGRAVGDYIAWLSSDDAWYPEKLAVQVKYLNDHPEIAAVFGKVDWVDEFNNIIDNFPYVDVFNVGNRTRYEWLRQFFMVGNCLSLPSSLVRREYFSEMGMFNPVLAGISDLDFWVRLCLKYDIMILDQKLIRNRWINDAINASGGTIKNHIRNRFEYRQILNHYLQIKEPQEFLLIFPDAAKYGTVTKLTIPYFLARTAIASGLDFKMLWGLDILFTLIQDEKLARFLEDEYDFTRMDFIRLVRECDSFRLAERQLLAKDAKKLTENIENLSEQVAQKERELQFLKEQIAEKERRLQSLTEQVAEKDRIIHDIQSGLAFLFISKYRQFINLLLPAGTKRRHLYTRIVKNLRGNR